MKLETTEHTFTLGARHYDVLKLWKIVRRRKPTWMRLDMVHGYNAHRSTGFSLVHFLWSDTRFPLLVEPNGKLIDGRHRILKMKCRNRKRVRVHIISKVDLEKARVRKPANQIVRDDKGSEIKFYG